MANSVRVQALEAASSLAWVMGTGLEGLRELTCMYVDLRRVWY